MLKKKFAFVSDYVRFYVLYHYGGIYLDTGVEVIKSFDDIIKRGPFMGVENEAGTGKLYVAPGLGCGCTSHHPVFYDLMNIYNGLHLKNNNNSNGIALMTIVHYTTDYFEKYGLKDINGIQSISDVNIYPKEYFCPKGPNSDKCNITTNTRSIHHYAASWYTWKTRLVIFIRKVLGERFLTYLLKLKQMI